MAVICAAEQRLPRPDAGEGRWMLRLSGSERLKVGGNSEIFYDGTARKADAQALAEALTKADFFTKAGEMVLLHKGADGAVISIPTNAEDGDDGDRLKPWDDPQVLAWAQSLGAQVAPSVGGPPIRMEILSAKGKVMKVLAIVAQ